MNKWERRGSGREGRVASSYRGVWSHQWIKGGRESLKNQNALKLMVAGASP